MVPTMPGAKKMRKATKYAYRRRRYATSTGRSALRNIQEKVHTFTRTQVVNSYASSSAAPALSEILMNPSLAFSNMPNYTEYTALFDQYRIIKVDFMFVPRYDSNDQDRSLNINFPIPQMYAVVDHTDNNLPSGVTELLQYSNLKTRQFLKPFKLSFKPATAIQSYNGLSSGYTPGYNKWIGTENPSVPYYGIRAVCDLKTIQWGTSYKIDVIVKYTFQCKNTK